MFRKSEAYGELEIDHRESPGFSEEVAWAVGFGGLDVGRGQRQRVPTKMCPHCQAQIVLNPRRRRARFECRSCDSVICDNCAVDMKLTGVCRPWKQVVDEWASGNKLVTVRSSAAC